MSLFNYLVLGICFLFFPFFVQGNQPLDVVINEIAWMGTKIEGIESKNWWQYEWIELYNNTSKPINLSGWRIENANPQRKSLEISEIEILAHSYLLVCKKEIKNCDWKDESLSLNNDYKKNGKLVLKDREGKIIDQTPEASNSDWPAGDKKTKQTMERKNPQLPGSDPINWGTSQNPQGTPKAKNSLTVTLPLEKLINEQENKSEHELPEEESYFKETPPEPKSYPNGIVINEFLPSPKGADETGEWIEIFNQNNFEVDLSGWKISDLEGLTTTYTFPKGTQISGRGFLVLSRQITKITLNNNRDGLNLLQPDGKIIDSVIYEKAPLSQSYNRIDSKWLWSSVLTAGSQNTIPTPSSEIKKNKLSKEDKEVPLEKEIKKEPEKQLATIGKQIPKKFSFLPLLVALSLAIFSGVIILILKNKLKQIYNKNV